MNKVQFIPSLTPLRGIAAILVVLFHYDIFMGQLAPPGNMIISKLYLMVDLFFVLSGFIMFHVYGTWFEQRVNRVKFINYMKARFARLYPLHLFMFLYLLIWACLLWFKIGRANLPGILNAFLLPESIPTSLLLIQAWGMHLEATWNTVSWSISVEWFLYLLFPFLVVFIAKFKGVARWSLGAVAILGFLVIMYYIQPHMVKLWNAARGIPPEVAALGPQNTIDLITGPALLRGLCGFIMGMLSYELYCKGWQKQLLQKGFWFVGIWSLLLLLWSGDWLPDILAVVLFSILILHAAYVDGMTKKILNNKVFTYLGDISYSIYMVHIPLILTSFILSTFSTVFPGFEDRSSNWATNWPSAFIFLAIVLVVASLTYRFIEVPMRKRLKKILIKN